MSTSPRDVHSSTTQDASEGVRPPLTSSPAPDSRPWERLPKWPRRVVTAWLLFHLIAIFSAPASVAPASQLARSTWSVCRPYLQTLYLNHGYHFFAPDPGESTLLAYTVEKADGTKVESAIPHPHIWPRLLYHRHFMLTESLGFVSNVSASMLPADERPTLDREATGDDVATEDATDLSERDTQRAPEELRGLLRDWYQSYADCLLHKHDGERVTLIRVMHYLPEIEWMQEAIARGEPLTLGEPDSFAEFPVGTFPLGDDRIDAMPDTILTGHEPEPAQLSAR